MFAFRGTMLLAIFLIAVPLKAEAQVGIPDVEFQRLTPAFQSQEIHPHPVLRALGEATVAAHGYPGAARINPATFGTPDQVRVGSNISLGGNGPLPSSDWLFGSTWTTNPYVEAQHGRWAGAYQYRRFDAGSVQDRNNIQTAHTLSGAYTLSDRWRVGAGVNILYEAISGQRIGADGEPASSRRGVSVDLGAHYTRSFAVAEGTLHTSWGASLTDFGPHADTPKDGISGAPSEEPLATRLRTGAAVGYALPAGWANRSPLSVDVFGALSKEMQAYDETGDLYGPFASLIQTWSAQPAFSTTSVTGDEQASLGEQIMHHLGAQVKVYDILSLQAGRFHEPEAVGGRQYTTLGWGVDLYYVTLNRSWTASAHNGSFEDLGHWQITARIPLSESPRNFWPSLLDQVGL